MHDAEVLDPRSTEYLRKVVCTGAVGMDVGAKAGWWAGGRVWLINNSLNEVVRTGGTGSNCAA